MTVRTKLINRRYRLERRIALTPTTETWLGFDNVLHRAIAVTTPRQEILRETAFLAEFLQRSQIATALHHRGIVAAFDSGEDTGAPFLITEFTGGEQLASIIQFEAPFDVDDVAILIEQVAGALDYANQRGFVHGSLDANSVVVDAQGAAKLLGLGIPTGSVPWPHSEVGSPLTFDDDVQAIARIAFAMLTGEEPDDTDPSVAGDAYQIDPDVPRNASDIVAIGLGASWARFSSAGAFARALRDWRDFDPVQFLPPPRATAESFEWQMPAEAVAQDLAGGYIDESFGAIDEPDPVEKEIDRPAAPRGVRLALVAALLLALLAGVVVWQGTETSVGARHPIPEPIGSLAQLSGF